MRSSTRFSLLIALCLACAGVLSAQENPNSKGGSISGRVTMANKGVAGVSVTITMSGDALSGSGLQLSASTDDEGKFRLSNLPARTYYVWPFVPAFVITEATSVYPRGRNVTVLAGESVEEVNFTLTRGAAITGKVRDSAGRVLVDERVRILPVQKNVQQVIGSVYPSINDIRTDDRGIYRVYGLPAGTYKVAVGDPVFAALSSTSGRRIYPETFHPDVDDEAKAEVIEIAEGSEANGVDITVARAIMGFAVSGRFIDSKSGQPVSNISFGLTVSGRGSARGYVSLRAASTENGFFQVDNLPPGTYAINVLSDGVSNYHGTSESFTIHDADVSDLEVKVYRGSSISGKVIVEGIDDRSILAKLPGVQLQAFMFMEGESIGTVSYSNLNADGSFQIESLRAGKVRLSLGSPDRNITPEFALFAIELNGVDKSQGIQIRDAENISGIRIVVGYGTGSIRGTVRVEGGTLPPGTFMDAAFGRPGSSLTIAHTRVDARGQFVFERVPPGNYDVGVNAYLQSGRVSARQAAVTSNGVTTEITVTLNLSSSPKPGP